MAESGLVETIVDHVQDVGVLRGDGNEIIGEKCNIILWLTWRMAGFKVVDDLLLKSKNKLWILVDHVLKGYYSLKTVE